MSPNTVNNRQQKEEYIIILSTTFVDIIIIIIDIISNSVIIIITLCGWPLRFFLRPGSYYVYGHFLIPSTPKKSQDLDLITTYPVILIIGQCKCAPPKSAHFFFKIHYYFCLLLESLRSFICCLYASYTTTTGISVF